MGKGEATWRATSNSLISGERDAVLIDTPPDTPRTPPGSGLPGKLHHGLHHPRPRRSLLRPDTILDAFPRARCRHGGVHRPPRPTTSRTLLDRVLSGS